MGWPEWCVIGMIAFLALAGMFTRTAKTDGQEFVANVVCAAFWGAFAWLLYLGGFFS
jgi:hypothetical protein